MHDRSARAENSIFVAFQISLNRGGSGGGFAGAGGRVERVSLWAFSPHPDGVNALHRAALLLWHGVDKHTHPRSSKSARAARGSESCINIFEREIFSAADGYFIHF
jgi:hypothetical protein